MINLKVTWIPLEISLTGDTNIISAITNSCTAYITDSANAMQ